MKKVLQFLFGFSGRVSRTKYALGALVLPFLTIALFVITIFVAQPRPNTVPFYTLLLSAFLTALLLSLSNLSFIIRRLYDMDHSAGWVFALWLSSLLALSTLAMPSPSTPMMSTLYFTIATGCYWLPALFLLFWPGTSGANRFGPNSRDKNSNDSTSYPSIGKKVRDLLRLSSRIRRKHFFLILFMPLLLSPVLLLLNAYAPALFGPEKDSLGHSIGHLSLVDSLTGLSGFLAFFQFISLQIALVAILPLYAFMSIISLPVQRFHDCNFSGKWVIIPVTLSCLLAWYDMTHIKALSDYTFNVIVFKVFILALFIWIYGRRGTVGTNQYGKDPRLTEAQ